MPNTDVKGLILMGGQSSRMGTDKAFVEWQGKTLLQHAIDRLQQVVSDFYLSVNHKQYEQLKDSYQCIPDKYIDKGPMGGILSALEHLKTHIIVVTVDMPNLTGKAISGLVESGKNLNTISCYQYNGSIQPFPSYWPKQFSSQLTMSLQKNHLSVIRLIKDLQPNLRSNEDPELFKNFNSPDDLRKV